MLLRPRRVGGRWLLAGTALVGGAAYRAARRRGAQQGGQQQEAVADEQSDPVEQIRELSELREQGILTEDEFTAEKKKLLGI